MKAKQVCCSFVYSAWARAATEEQRSKVNIEVDSNV